jgi:gamma-glutamyltranspeptidase
MNKAVAGLASSALTFLLPALLLAQENIIRDYGRSMTITRHGIAATSQILASQAGAEMLARGGSAADAAIAANAVLGLTEPMMDGIGGDLFSLYWDAASGKLYGLNASGWTAKGMTLDYFAKKGLKAMPGSGIDSATVPGCVGGWAAIHKRFGKLPWKELFEPAIHYATEGFPVTERIAASWGGASVKRLKLAEGAPEIFLPNGEVPTQGQVFRNPALARAYTLIATQGADAFYRGAQTRGRDGSLRPRRVAAGMGGADLHHLSRLACFRIAAQRARHRRAGNAERDGAAAATSQLWADERRGAALED